MSAANIKEEARRLVETLPDDADLGRSDVRNLR